MQLTKELAADKKKYFAAFVPGLESVIEKVVRERLPDVSIRRLVAGAIIFETAVRYDSLNFFCFNNIFALMDIQDTAGQADDGRRILENHIRKILASKKSWPQMGGNNRQIQTFRLFCSVENKPASIDETLKTKLEARIADASGLAVNRAKPDTEFWFLFRREGFSCFMKRLSNHRKGEKSLHPGELSPQLAWALCRFADLKHGETAADPFSGYGAIPLAACKYFPLEKIYASDSDPRCVKHASSRPGLLKNERAVITRADFRTLPDLLPKTDAVVTDPPWGMYQSGIPLQSLYDDMLSVFKKILAPGGRAVILSAATTELETAAGKTKGARVRERMPVLVSGKKAVIFIVDFA